MYTSVSESAHIATFRVCFFLELGTSRTEIKLRYSQSRAKRFRTKVMTQTSQLTIEHVVIQSTRSYEEVKAALEECLGVMANTDGRKRKQVEEIGKRKSRPPCS